MELWTLSPNLHLSFQDTFFCLLLCFVCPCLALFVSMFFACSPYILCFFLCLSTGLFPCLLHVHTCRFVACTHMEQGHDLLGMSKKGKDASKKTQAQKGQCLVDWRLSLPKWLPFHLLFYHKTQSLGIDYFLTPNTLINTLPNRNQACKVSGLGTNHLLILGRLKVNDEPLDHFIFHHGRKHLQG